MPSLYHATNPDQDSQSTEHQQHIHSVFISMAHCPKAYFFPKASVYQQHKRYAGKSCSIIRKTHTFIERNAVSFSKHYRQPKNNNPIQKNKQIKLFNLLFHNRTFQKDSANNWLQTRVLATNAFLQTNKKLFKEKGSHTRECLFL